MWFSRYVLMNVHWAKLTMFVKVRERPRTKSSLAFRLVFIKLLSVNGDGEIRTLDPLLARQVLSQLSYTPTFLATIYFALRRQAACPTVLTYTTYAPLLITCLPCTARILCLIITVDS